MTTNGIASISTSTPAPQAVTPNALAADKDTFLKLLVAQLRHQNPLEPADGLQFVTQLAQFTALEHSASIREDLDAIRAAMERQAANSAQPGNTQES
jgi:flagellar basal-body rod modification protein FlgD